jgi:TonB family protein
MHDYTNDIKRYLSGGMTAAESHALEKRALSDPFLADALEGALSMNADDYATDVTNLQKQISGSVNASSLKTPINVWQWSLRVAAAITILVLSTFVVWKYITVQQKPEQLALEEKPNEIETPAQVITIDTVKTEAALSTQKSAQTNDRKVTRTTTPVATTQPNMGAMPALADAASVAPEERKIAEATGAEVTQYESKAAKIALTEEVAAPAMVADDEKSKVTAPKVIESESKREERVKKSTDKTVAGSPLSNLIQGKVISAEDGTALPGVNVVIKGTAIGTVTDANGNYQLPQIDSNQQLVYSFIGLQSKEVSTSNQTEVNVQMALDMAQLSEVVVTGNGINQSNAKPTQELARPETGTRTFNQYLQKNRRYPQEAIDKKITGNVVIEFFVEADGTLTNFNIVKGIGGGCDEELIRLIKEGPKWQPSTNNGVPIRDQARVQLRFKLP